MLFRKIDRSGFPLALVSNYLAKDAYLNMSGVLNRHAVKICGKKATLEACYDNPKEIDSHGLLKPRRVIMIMIYRYVRANFDAVAQRRRRWSTA